MNRTTKRIGAMLLTAIFICNLLCMTALAASRTTVYNKGEWTVYLDSPDSAKPYYHLHFYQKRNHIYCLRLDNMQPCDGTKNNKSKVPESVKIKAMAHPKVKKATAFHTPAINSNWVKNIAKPLLIVGAAVLVVISAVNIFTGPIDDVAAWAALSAALGM